MWQNRADENLEEVYLAGEKARPGLYRQVGGIREIKLEIEDALPASLDGQVACYTRVRGAWSQGMRSRERQ